MLGGDYRRAATPAEVEVMKALVDRAMKDGAIDFLVKPFPLTQMDAAVERALATAATRRRIADLGAAGPPSSV